MVTIVKLWLQTKRILQVQTPPYVPKTSAGSANLSPQSKIIADAARKKAADDAKRAAAAVIKVADDAKKRAAALAAKKKVRATFIEMCTSVTILAQSKLCTNRC